MRVLLTFGLLLSLGCASSIPTATPSFDPSARACDSATADAESAWKRYAIEMRLEAIQSYANGASAFAEAAQEEARTAGARATESGDRLRVARAMAARSAAGDAAVAAERAELLYDDALDDAANPARFTARYEAIRQQAVAAYNDAHHALDVARRNSGGDAVMVAQANQAMTKAVTLLDRASEADGAAADGPQGAVAGHPSDRNLERAEELTENARAVCHGEG